MSGAIPQLCHWKLDRLVVLSVCGLLLLMLAPAVSRAQKPRAAAASADDDEQQPSFGDFKGVRLGMTADDARKKLGTPQDKGVEQDFYVFNGNQAVQVYYDKSGLVTAISIDFMSGATGIPTPKEVLGVNAEPKPDGSIYKMIRYRKAGYWVSYNKGAGDSPTVTITMQKI